MLKSSGFFNHLSVSDKTLVIMLTTIFVLLLLITALLVAFVRYRRLLWSRLNKKHPDYSQGTVMRNYMRGKTQSDGEEKPSPSVEEKYHNLFATAGSPANNDKQIEKRRNQPGGYSEYGTLIHNSTAQTMANMDIGTIKRDGDYQPLGHFPNIMDNYQLPLSHVIINDSAINNSRYEIKPRTLLRNIYISPSKQNTGEDTNQHCDRLNSKESVSRGQSLETESMSPLMYRMYSTNDEPITVDSTIDSPSTNKSSNRSKLAGSFVLKNVRANEESPKKSVFGSFV